MTQPDVEEYAIAGWIETLLHAGDERSLISLWQCVTTNARTAMMTLTGCRKCAHGQERPRVLATCTLDYTHWVNHCHNNNNCSRSDLMGTRDRTSMR
eukprot:SAG11_NODE_12496_length_700_cov_1.023295_1_plen_96_part_01